MVGSAEPVSDGDGESDDDGELDADGRGVELADGGA